MLLILDRKNDKDNEENVNDDKNHKEDDDKSDNDEDDQDTGDKGNDCTKCRRRKRDAKQSEGYRVDKYGENEGRKKIREGMIWLEMQTIYNGLMAKKIEYKKRNISKVRWGRLDSMKKRKKKVL